MENPASQLGSPNWNLPPPSSSVALRCCRWTTAKSWDPRWVALGPWGSSGFLWLVTWVAEDVYTIYKWNKPRIGDLRSPGSFILCVSQLRWSSIIANPWHFSCWTWWTMGFWVDSFGGLNLQKTVVSTSGKKGVSGKSSSSIHPILVGDKSPLLEVYFASETMIFVGHPPFWEASNGDFTSKFWRILKTWNLPMSISTIKWRRIKIQGSGICLVWNGCTVHNSWLPTRQFWIPHS